LQFSVGGLGQLNGKGWPKSRRSWKTGGRGGGVAVGLSETMRGCRENDEAKELDPANVWPTLTESNDAREMARK